MKLVANLIAARNNDRIVVVTGPDDVDLVRNWKTKERGSENEPFAVTNLQLNSTTQHILTDINILNVKLNTRVFRLARNETNIFLLK